jgi:hypothetical protein
MEKHLIDAAIKAIRTQIHDEREALAEFIGDQNFSAEARECKVTIKALEQVVKLLEKLFAMTPVQADAAVLAIEIILKADKPRREEITAQTGLSGSALSIALREGIKIIGTAGKARK